MIALLTLLLFSSTAHAFPGGEDGARLVRAAEALHELRLEDAEPELRALAARHPRDADVQYQLGVLLFHRGDYAAAASAMDLARGAQATGASDRRALRDIVVATRDATANFEEATSDDGRYVVKYAPGQDRILVMYAMEALRAGDQAIEDEIGVHIPGPIRLEIYPAARELARVSTLTVEDIERTGTIALCKWDRLMITSPRALVRGYPWMDTIAHELVHLVLARGSRDRAPVWLQEGFAKFLERKWRGETPTAHLDAASRALLEDAVREDRLIPFEQLHPSIARLPSQRDAALAFAQVATFIESVRNRHGTGVLARVVAGIADGKDAKVALRDATSVSFETLEREWREMLAAMPPRDETPPRLLGLRFRHGDAEPDESSDVEDRNARRFLRLGDLLWVRGRPRAAAAEYGRAHSVAPDDPVVGSRYARASLAGGQPAQAIAVLLALRERYPDHAPLHAVLGGAYLAQGDLAQAVPSLGEAIRLNPFDPQPHCDLAAARVSEPVTRHEQAICRQLGGTPSVAP